MSLPWIKLWIRVQESEIFRPTRATSKGKMFARLRYALWMDMLIWASESSPSKNGLKRGQFEMRLDELVKISRMDRRQVRYTMEKLEENGMIRRERGEGHSTIYTILNWEKYQARTTEDSSVQDDIDDVPEVNDDW